MNNSSSPAGRYSFVEFLQFREPTWWIWFATATCLVLGLSGVPFGFPAAIGLAVAHTLVFLLREGFSFPVQIRGTYSLILFTAQVPAMWWMNISTLLGTLALLFFGYCLLARLLSLCPWNRTEKLTFSLIRRTLFSRPTRGNVHQGLPACTCTSEGRIATLTARNA